MRFISFALLVLFGSLKGIAQDVVYSRMNNSGLYLNPAFAGFELHQNISVLHKLQWKALGFPYSSTNISLIKPLYSSGEANHPKGGIGIDINSEISGEAKYSVISAAINPCYNIVSYDESRGLYSALKLGIRQRTLSSNFAEWGTQFDPFNGYDGSYPADPNEKEFRPVQIMPDIGAGMIYGQNMLHHDPRQRHVGFAVGYAGFHLNRPNESFFRNIKSPTSIVHRGFVTVLLNSPAFSFKPTATATYQRTRTLLQAGADLDVMLHATDSPILPDMILLGGRYNSNNVISGMLGLKNDYWTIGFNYDVAAGTIEHYSGISSGWELFIRIQKKRNEIITKIVNPDRPNY